MSIECYNTLCNFHNKIDNSCKEDECHCVNGDPEAIIYTYPYDPPYEMKVKQLVCHTCKTAHKCTAAWIDQNQIHCMIEVVWGLVGY